MKSLLIIAVFAVVCVLGLRTTRAQSVQIPTVPVVNPGHSTSECNNHSAVPGPGRYNRDPEESQLEFGHFHKFRAAPPDLRWLHNQQPTA